MKKIFVAATVGLLFSLTPVANAEVAPVKSDNAFVNQSNARDKVNSGAEDDAKRATPKFDGLG